MLKYQKTEPILKYNKKIISWECKKFIKNGRKAELIFKGNKNNMQAHT